MGAGFVIVVTVAAGIINVDMANIAAASVARISGACKRAKRTRVHATTKENEKKKKGN